MEPIPPPGPGGNPNLFRIFSFVSPNLDDEDAVEEKEDHEPPRVGPHAQQSAGAGSLGLGAGSQGLGAGSHGLGAGSHGAGAVAQRVISPRNFDLFGNDDDFPPVEELNALFAPPQDGNHARPQNLVATLVMLSLLRQPSFRNFLVNPPRQHVAPNPANTRMINDTRLTLLSVQHNLPLLMRDLREKEPQRYKCGICLDSAKIPSATKCGHLFCREELNKWFDTRPSCPNCRVALAKTTDVVALDGLKKTIDAWKKTCPVFAKKETAKKLEKKFPKLLEQEAKMISILEDARERCIHKELRGEYEALKALFNLVKEYSKKMEKDFKDKPDEVIAFAKDTVEKMQYFLNSKETKAANGLIEILKVFDRAGLSREERIKKLSDKLKELSQKFTFSDPRTLEVQAFDFVTQLAKKQEIPCEHEHFGKLAFRNKESCDVPSALRKEALQLTILSLVSRLLYQNQKTEAILLLKQMPGFAALFPERSVSAAQVDAYMQIRTT